MKDIKTTNIMDCLDQGLSWINNDNWNQMIKDIWSTLEFQKRSDSSRRNRQTKTDGKISTHSGGTVSFASYRASMQEQAGGKEPAWENVFTMLHQNAKQPGTFIDNKSKQVVDNYKKEMISKYGTDRKNHPSFDRAAWCVASRGVSKGRIYGAPGMTTSKVNMSSSSHSYSVESAHPGSCCEALLKEKDDRISELNQEINLIKEFLFEKLGYHGGRSNTDTPPYVASSLAPHFT